MAGTVVSGTFSGTGQSATAAFRGDVNLSLDFAGSATVLLQRTFDGGSTWKTVATFTEDYEGGFTEIEEGVEYRLNCTVHSANVVYRMSQTYQGSRA